MMKINTLIELDEALNQSKGKHIIKISTSSCLPCRMIDPFLEEFVIEYPEITFYSVVADTAEEAQDIGIKLRAINISTVPTFIILEDGTEKRVSGAFSKTKLKEVLGLT